MTAFLARRERFDAVESTNDVVRAWLAGGTPEVCLAVAGEQSAGRGRDGRQLGRAAGRRAPAVARLPPDVACPGPVRGDWPPSRPWRWPMPPNAWPASRRGPSPSSGRTTSSSRPARRSGRWPASWARPMASGRTTRAPSSGSGSTSTGRRPISRRRSPDSMTSLREATGGRPIDRDDLLEAFVRALEPRVDALRAGRLRRHRLGPATGHDGPDDPAHHAVVGRDGRRGRRRSGQRRAHRR